MYLKNIVILSLMLFILTACAAQAPFKSSAYTSNPGYIPFLALGDSYTIGENVKSAERWPVQLTSNLRKKGVPLAEPLIIARTGWTTEDLEANINQYGPDKTFGLVTLMIGVNNQYHGHNLAEYREDFQKLLKRAIRYADNDPLHVLVFSIPDWSVTPYARTRNRSKISKAIDDFNRVNYEETSRAGAQYIDITDMSRAARSDTSLLAKDGLHPSGKMYAEWVTFALPQALKVLDTHLTQLDTITQPDI